MQAKTTKEKIHNSNSNLVIGGDEIAIIAGPDSAESQEQTIETAMAAKNAGSNGLRGGAFKPRTSPYSFQDWAKMD